EPEPDVRARHASPLPEPEPDEILTKGLEKTKGSLFGRLSSVFSGAATIDVKVLDDLEDALLLADVGVGFATTLVDELRSKVNAKELSTGEDVREALKARMLEVLKASDGGDPLDIKGESPKVILFVGVNGVGKTTTIGKIASKLKDQGKNVVLAAGDTYRAAAVEQLQIWGERTDCRVITGDENADPASVIFNALSHGKEKKVDYVLADTAGRLHTKSNLMEEIQKVKRAAGKAHAGAPHETWLVLDSTTGQNALIQAKEFNKTLGLTGVILTKLDGTAKGGVVVAIANALSLPVRFIGVGEQAADLRPFNSRSFVDALFARK
ncbi:signal recognition particle-docking protein FtsY, partial [Myxococcota bacterium]|nr:signal recognition particle-docking protein FtsY [Myxococcota bacterium]